MEIQSKILNRLLKRASLDEAIVNNPAVLTLIQGIDTTITELKEQNDRTIKMVEKSNEEIARYLADIEQKNKIIAEKNADLLAIYQNLRQGIMVVDASLSIMPNYSPSVAEIFSDQSEFASKSAIKVIFKNSDIGLDGLDQIEQALSCGFEQPPIFFEANAHLLPKRIIRIIDAKDQFLEIDWIPIDTGDVLKKVMIVVTDMTSIVKMQAEAKAQKRDLSMIGEIIACGNSNVDRYLESVTNLLSHCERLIRSHLDEDAINGLMRSLHTIKGNSRQVGFEQVTDQIHTLEQLCIDARDANTLQSVTDLIRTQVAEINEIIKAYKALYLKIYRSGLNPSESDFYKAFGEAFKIYHNKNDQDKKKMRETFLTDMIKTYQNSQNVSLLAIFSDFKSYAISLAKELGKEEPNFAFAISDTYLTKEFSHVFQDAFTHIIRNCIDHGIEPKSERTAQKKPANGLITVVLTKEASNSYLLKVHDDGQGLNLVALRNRSKKEKLLDEKDLNNSAKLANLIFMPGFSTAEKVTTVSGRGVGMDVVRCNLEEQGCKVSLEFLDTSESASGRRAFAILVQIPGNHFAVMDT